MHYGRLMMTVSRPLVMAMPWAFAFALLFVVAILFEFALHFTVSIPILFFVLAVAVLMASPMTAFIFPWVG